MSVSTNTAFARRYGLSVGFDERKGQIPPNANVQGRRTALRKHWTKDRLPNESFRDWKTRRETAVAQGA